jgi:zona occludens toxin
MLTLITGTPGAGKSLYTVWNIARKVPGSTIESGNVAVPRRLFSNIKDLLVEHTHITAEDLNTWHEWAKPGDVIVFDEVQEVWRPRGMGSKVPDCIAKLETHRHMGVDLVLITQHPMLLDTNIRRLVNQHIHLRRLAKTLAMWYEWDHCSNPGMTKTCIHSGTFWHPKEAYKLYKSAQLHTKPTTKIPSVAWLGLLAIGGLAYAAPTAYERISGSLGVKPQQTQVEQAAAPVPAPVTITPVDDQGKPVEQPPTETPAPLAALGPSPAPISYPQGCISSATRCVCFGHDGGIFPMPDDQCRESSYTVGRVIPAGQRPQLSTPPL